MNPFDIGYYESAELRTFGFASIGENVRIAKNCVIVGPENIEIGNDVRIDAFTTLIAARARLRLLGGNHIGGHAHLLAADDLTFGEFSGCSQGARFYTATDDVSGDWMMGPCVPSEYTNTKVRPITIGRHCSIGSGSVVLPGVVFEDGAVLGALSMAVRRLRAWQTYFGAPARAVMQRRIGALSCEAQLLGLRVAA